MLFKQEREEKGFNISVEKIHKGILEKFNRNMLF